MTHEGWTCPKCGNERFDVGQIRASGGGISSVLDVESKRFASVTCERCHYTEFYRSSAKAITKVLDFFTT